MNIDQELYTIIKKWADFISKLNGDLLNDRKIATQIVTTFGPMSEELSHTMQNSQKYAPVNEVLELAADLEWQDYPTALERKKDWDRLTKIIIALHESYGTSYTTQA